MPASRSKQSLPKESDPDSEPVSGSEPLRRTTPGNLFVLTGPSGVGKNTIIERVLAEAGGIVESVSVTTRKQRERELDGVDYFFTDRESFEKMKTLYDYGVSGLPYEMVINSNPSIAYLMRDNSLALQILTIAHVYGHNDFFKKNFTFRSTRAEFTIETFKSHANRVRQYVEDPSIGLEKVEAMLDAMTIIDSEVAEAVGRAS